MILKNGELKLYKDFFGFSGNFHESFCLEEVKSSSRINEFPIFKESQKTNDSKQILYPDSKGQMWIPNKNPLLIAGMIWSDATPQDYLNELSLQLSKDDFEILSEIDGEFSIAHASANKLILYRNLNSQKSIFYTVREGVLYYSTSLLDLIDNESKLNKQTFAAVCMGEGAIPFDGVYSIKNGEMLLYENGTIKLSEIEKQEIKSKKENPSVLSRKVKDYLSDSVKKRSAFFDNVSVMLSGGIDSAITLASLAKADNKDTKFSAITWGSKDFCSNEDFEYVDKIKKMYNHKQYKLDIGKTSVIGWDSKSLFPNNHGLYFWWKKASELAMSHEIKCLFSGAGGDTMFDRELSKKIKDLNIFEKWTWFIQGVTVPYYNMGIDSLFVKKTKLIEERRFNGPANRLLDIFSEDAINDVKNFFMSPSSQIDLQLLTLDHELFFSNNIRHTSPYFDKKVHSLASSLTEKHTRFPFHGMEINKPILRLAFKNELPAEVVSRLAPSNFEEILYKNILLEKQNIFDFLSNSLLSQLGIIDNKKLDRVFKDRVLFELNTTTIIICVNMGIWLENLIKERLINVT